jgi:hypothetical protein
MDSGMFLASHQAGYGVSRGGLAPQKRQWRSNGQNTRPRKMNKTSSSQRGSGVASEWSAGMYDPPRLMELQRQNRIRTRRHFPKRRKSVPRVPPRAPFNDSSYLMRVRQSGGLASSASPATPATPAFVSTPVFASPAPQFREGPEGDVKDYGYGSMEGLIHLKLCPDEPSHASTRMHSVDDVQGPPQSVQQVEQQLDHDVSRFEMTLPSGNGLSRRTQLMEVRLAEQESHIAYLEDENLTLKERLFLAQQEANELRQRLRRGGSCISVVDEHDDACSDYGSSD